MRAGQQVAVPATDRPALPGWAVWAGPLLVVLVGPLALFPQFFPRPGVILALLLLLLPFGLRWAATRRLSVPTPLTPFLLLLLLALPLALWVTPLFWEAAWPKLTGLLWAVAVYFEVVNWAAARPGATRPVAVLTLLYLALGVGSSDKLPLLGAVATRLPNLLGGLAGEGFHANQVAGTLLLFAPLAVALTLGLLFFPRPGSDGARWHPAGRWPARRGLLLGLLGLVALFLLGTLLLTQSRGGLLGLALALGVLLLLMGRRGWLLLGVGLALGVVGLLLVGPGRVADSLLYANNSSLLYGPLGLRLQIWQRGWQALADFPFTGVGLGSFRYLLAEFYPLPDLKGAGVNVVDLAHAHNLFLQTALDLGWLGLAAFALLWGVAVACLGQLGRRVAAWDRYWVLGLAGSLLAYLLYSLTDAVALGSRPGVAFWFLLALIMAAAGEAAPPAGVAQVQRRQRWLAAGGALALVLGLLAIAWWQRPPSLAVNRVAVAAAQGVLGGAAPGETPAGPCAVNWYVGLWRQAAGDEPGRDAAWQALLACSDNYIAYMALFAPENGLLAAQAVQAQPGSAAAYFWQASVPGTPPEVAVAALRQGLQLAPGDGLRWLALGDLLLADDPLAAVEAYLMACLNGDPGGNGCWRAGQTAEALGDPTAALAYYRLSRVDKALARAGQLEANGTPRGADK